MKVKVNQEACIACGSCSAICDLFEVGDFAEVKVEEVPEDKKEDVLSAKDSCPTGAIEVEE